jgi:hypothetical protein
MESKNKRTRSRSIGSSKRKKNNEISYYDETWPDKIVILITSHGSFSRDYVGEDSVIQKIKVPEGIKIDYLYASAHGSVTAYRENDAKRMFDFTKKHLPEILSNNQSDKKKVLSQYSDIMIDAKDDFLDNVTNDIKNYKQLLENSRQMYNKQTNKNIKYKEKIDEMTKPLIPFVDHHNKSQKYINNSYSKGFTYKTYNENEFIPNKSFYRGVKDIFIGKNIGAQKYNYAIRLMNLKNQPDILDLLQSNRGKMEDITTQKMIELCLQHGVKEITIIDSACGSINGNDRELRNIRRDINREPNVEFLLNTKNMGESTSPPRKKRNISRSSSRSHKKTKHSGGKRKTQKTKK